MDINTLELIGLAVTLIRVVLFIACYNHSGKNRDAASSSVVTEETYFDMLRETK